MDIKIFNMKYLEYRQAFDDLKQDVITEVKHQLIKENAAEIELHSGIIHSIDDHSSPSQYDVIKRVNVEISKVTLDTGDDYYSLDFNDLSLDELLAILQLVETGSYDVWAEFEVE